MAENNYIHFLHQLSKQSQKKCAKEIGILYDKIINSFDKNARIKAENGENNIMFYCFEINECENDILITRLMTEGLLDKLRTALYPAVVTYKKLFLDRKSREYIELAGNKTVGFCANKACQEWGALFINWDLDAK